MVFEKGDDRICRQAIGLGKQKGFPLVRVHDPVSLCADPEPTMAITENSSGRQGRRRARKRIIYDFFACDLIDAVRGDHHACAMIALREGVQARDWYGQTAGWRTRVPSPEPCRRSYPQAALGIFI